jgi:nucleoside-triphosphatase THEP1
VVHRRLEDPLIERVKAAAETKEYEVTFENRDKIPEEIWTQVRSFLKPSAQP